MKEHSLRIIVNDCNNCVEGRMGDEKDKDVLKDFHLFNALSLSLSLSSSLPLTFTFSTLLFIGNDSVPPQQLLYNSKHRHWRHWTQKFLFVYICLVDGFKVERKKEKILGSKCLV